MARKRARDSKGRFISKSRARSKRSRKRSYKRNLPPRDSKGRFTSRGGGRRSYRRNPPGGDLVGKATQGAMDAGAVLVGKAATRSIPQLLSLPQTGNTGLAVQAATAVAAGWAADRFVGPDVGRFVLAGGLTAPMESLIIRFNVPWLSTALAGGGSVGRYVSPGSVRGYVPGAHRNGMNGVAGYVSPGSRSGAGAGVVYHRN